MASRKTQQRKPRAQRATSNVFVMFDQTQIQVRLFLYFSKRFVPRATNFRIFLISIKQTPVSAFGKWKYGLQGYIHCIHHTANGPCPIPSASTPSSIINPFPNLKMVKISFFTCAPIGSVGDNWKNAANFQILMWFFKILFFVPTKRREKLSYPTQVSRKIDIDSMWIVDGPGLPSRKPPPPEMGKKDVKINLKLLIIMTKF